MSTAQFILMFMPLRKIDKKQTNKQTKKIRERLPVYEDKNELNEFEEKPINKDDDIENGMSCKRKKSLKKLKKVKGKDFFDWKKKGIKT